MTEHRYRSAPLSWVAALALTVSAQAQPFPACDDPPPGAGNCATATPGVPGCLDHLCCEAVCADDSFCCDEEWDSNCADQALALCKLAANDDCVDAAPIALNQVVAFDTTNATTDGSGAMICLLDGGFDLYHDIWYEFIPAVTGTYTASLCGSSFDTMLAVYAGCNACPPTAEPIVCSDDACNFQSEVEFSASAGQCMLIRVGGHALGNNGEGTLVVSSTLLPPANDLCGGAIPLALPSTVTGSTLLATPDPGAPSPCGETQVPDSPGVWYRVTGNGNTLTATTCNPSTNFDTELTIYCGPNCATLACVAGNDDTPGPFDPDCDSLDIGVNSASTVSWCSAPGVTYWILVHGFFGAAGTFQLTVSSGAACNNPPSCSGGGAPANDLCVNAITIGLGDRLFSNIGASTDGPAHAACNSGGDQQVSDDVWFRHTAALTGDLTVTTCGLIDYDSRIAVYGTGSCAAVGNGTLLGCNDDDPVLPCGSSGHASVTVAVTQGVPYLIRVGGTAGAEGSGTLRLTASLQDPACPGPGSCFAAHGTPGCEDEDCCNAVCTVLPQCCDGAWSAACAAEAVNLCPPPPPCTLSASLCQEADQQKHGTDDVVAAISDTNTGYNARVADNFTAATTDSITEACWWGLYADLGPPTVGDCGPGTGDAFTITYYLNTPGSPNVPGAIHAGPFAVVPAKALTGEIVPSAIGPIREYQFTAAHPPVAVQQGASYWVEILNHTTGSCGWLWSTGPGNALAHQAIPAGNSYSAKTAVDFDLAWCLSIPAPPCPWDLNHDGLVGINDLLILLPAWGNNPGHPADFDGNGAVGVTDLLALLIHWGPC